MSAPDKPTMDRLSISLPSVLTAWLRAEAKRSGVSIGELLRRIVDQARNGK